MNPEDDRAMLRTRVFRGIAAASIVLVALAPSTVAVAQPTTPPKFWVKCLVTEPERAIDPIVSPGGASAHTHVFFGQRVNSLSTGASLRERARTNCSAKHDFSAYWVPTVYDADGVLLTPDDVSVYYRRARPGRVVPFPQDFAEVSFEVRYSCGKTTPSTEGWTTCPAPSSPRIIVEFAPGPDDVNFPEVRVDVRWLSWVGADASTWRASSDTGARHGDFLNAWTRSVLRRLIDRCLNDPTPANGGTPATKACGLVTGTEG